jgi:hypothetical protein
MADDKVSLCRLWKKEGRTGEYFVGRTGGARVLVFQNRSKADDSEHDAEIFVVNAQPAANGQLGTAKAFERRAPKSDNEGRPLH